MTNEDKQFFEELFGGLENMEKGFGYDYNIFCCEQVGYPCIVIDFFKSFVSIDHAITYP